jgi:hypothetical protein
MNDTKKVISAFDALLNNINTNIKHIVFDLDATLGKSPGWHCDEQSLYQYVHKPHALKALIQHLHDTYNIRSVMVSRNGAFCDEVYKSSARQAFRMGFHEVAECSRRHTNVPKSAFVRGADPSTVLLIDDQEAECVLAAKHGALAVLCDKKPIFETVLSKPVVRVFHHKPARRRKTGGRRRLV